MAEPARKFDIYPESGEREILADNTLSQKEPVANLNKPPQENSNVIPFIGRTSNVQKTYKPVPEKYLSDRVHAAGTTAQIGGGVAQGTGAVVQGTGRVAGRVGSGMTRAGAALSATGVGAIVGVPLAAAGVVTTGTGKGLEAGGKGIRKGGKSVTKKGTQIKRASRVAKGMSTREFVAKNVNIGNRFNPIVRRRMDRIILGKTEAEVDKAKVKSRARLLITIGWIVAFPVAVFNGIFIYLFNAWNEVQDGGFWSIAKSAVTFNLDEAAIKAGYYFNSDMLMAFMITSWAAGFALAAGFLFIALKVMSGTGAETKNSSIKEGLVLAAFVAAFVPMANVWPWTNSLVKHVSKHPE